jgi:hypothetical protein
MVQAASCTEFYRAGLPKSYIAVRDDRALPDATYLLAAASAARTVSAPAGEPASFSNDP